MQASTTMARACALAAFLGAMAACAGESDQAPATPPPVTGGNPIDSGTTPPGPPDNTIPPGSEVDSGTKTPKPKAIGSPCTDAAECAAGLTCNTTFPGGACTKDCSADTDCAGKGGAVGACIDALCFASCAVEPDAGVVVEDAGKPKAPCKNKAFACVAVDGKAGPVCIPSLQDSGASD